LGKSPSNFDGKSASNFDDTQASDVSIPLDNLPEGNRNFTTEFTDDYDTISGSIEPTDPAYKPYPFALRPAPDGKMHIYYGVLVHQINRMVFDVDGFVEQAGLTDPETIAPSNFDGDGNRYKFYELDWRGDVYLYWTTNSAGVVETCVIQEEKGESKTLPDPDDDSAGGKFSVKIGSVPSYEIADLDQIISSDFYWISAFSVQEDTSGSDGGGGGGGGSYSSSSGSDKSTAIVPMGWHDKGYGALFTMESNEVLFEFVLRDVTITGATTKVAIDDRFLAVCEPDSMVVTGIVGDKAGAVGAVVEEDEVILSAWPLPCLRPTKATLKLTGVRKGFRNLDMPERSKEQFTANEKFINSAYPRNK
tara:strand:+ start:69 stop:1154 length:1086 start_codon:yes stop_codon:yes gene_type:complete